MNKLKIIAAIDSKNGFGKGGKIPWHCPEDLKHFKLTTKDSYCIFGRNTYADMATYFKKEFMPGRKSILISSSEDTLHDNVLVFGSIQDALEYIHGQNNEKDVYFIGGRGIFDAAINIATECMLTVMPGDYECDVFFPMEKLIDELFELSFVNAITEDATVKCYQYTRSAWRG